MPQPLQYTHTISLRRKHDSIVYLNETCLLCANKMVFLISCRSWMTALSDTVTLTRRLFWVISTAPCHQADECSSSWRERASLSRRRTTGTEYRARSGTRHTLLNQKPFVSLNTALWKYLIPVWFFFTLPCLFPDMLTLAWGRQHHSCDIESTRLSWGDHSLYQMNGSGKANNPLCLQKNTSQSDNARQAFHRLDCRGGTEKISRFAVP